MLAIPLLSVVLTWPVLWHGFPIQGHDAMLHGLWTLHFGQQFLEGEWYPRWLMGMNDGLGSPAFFFYPPVPYWLTAPFLPLFDADFAPWRALGLTATIALAASGLFTYGWLRAFLSPLAAFAGSVAYMIAPYHLLIDLYMRAAWAEYWAMTWLPLILCAAHRIAMGRHSHVLLLALATALLAMSHLLTLMLFVLIPVIYVAWTAPEHRKLKALLLTHLGMAWGMCMAAVYVVPAMNMQSTVSMGELWGRFGAHLFRNHHLSYLWASPLTDIRFLMVFTFIGTMLLVLLTFIGVHIRYRLQKTDMVHQVSVFCVSIAVLSFWLTTNSSHMVWENIQTLQKVQFPWRLGTVLSLMMAALMACLTQALCASSARFRVTTTLWLAVAVVGILGVTAMSAVAVTDQKLPTLRDMLKHPDAPEYRPQGVPLSTFLTGVTRSDTTQQAVSAVCNDIGEHTQHWTAVKHAAREMNFSVETKRGCLLTVRHFFFPQWHMFIDQQHQGQAGIMTANGLITADIPPGKHDVTFRLMSTDAETFGLSVSVAATAAWILIMTLFCRTSIAIRQADADSCRSI